MSNNPNGPEKAFLVVQRGGDIGSIVNLDRGQVTIGRNSDNVIVLNDPMISRYHAVLQYNSNNGTITIIDLGSTNGVIVNDKPIDPGLPFTLQKRDSIYVGHSVFNLQVRPRDHQPSRPGSKGPDPEATQRLNFNKLFS